jgi:hypothetical protein
MNHDQYLSFLKDEYAILQRQYEDFDQRALTIKGWIGAGSAVALGSGVADTDKITMLLCLVVVFIAIVFWVIEAYWKTFQYCLSDRIRIIEAIFRDDKYLIAENQHPFQIYNWWFRSLVHDAPIFPNEQGRRPRSRRRRFFDAALQPFVLLPYAPLSALALGILIWTAFSRQ